MSQEFISTNSQEPDNRQGRFGMGIIPVENFQGDPRRVIGHPSNPTTGIGEAFASSSQHEQSDGISKEVVAESTAMESVSESSLSDIINSIRVKYPHGVLVRRGNGTIIRMQVSESRIRKGIHRDTGEHVELSVPDGYVQAIGENGDSKIVAIEGLDKDQSSLEQELSAESARRIIKRELGDDGSDRSALEREYDEVYSALDQIERQNLFFYLSELSRLIKIDALNGKNQRLYQEVYGLVSDRRNKLSPAALKAANLKQKIGLD